MDNPAARMLKITDKWIQNFKNLPQMQAIEARGANTQERLDSSQSFVNALSDLDALITNWEKTQMEDVSTYREIQRRWLEIALNIPRSWQQAARKNELFPPSDLTQLNVLSALIESRSQSSASPLVRREVERILATVEEALRQDQGLPDVVAHYLERLIERIRESLAEDKFDRLKEDLVHLWNAVYSAGAQSEEKRLWRKASEKFSYDVLVATSGSIGATGLLALTSVL